MSRKLWVGGNWKCNGTKGSVDTLIKTLNEADLPPAEALDVVVAPPHLWLTHTIETIKDRVTVSSQDCNQFGMGAYTGSLSPEMLLDAGIKTTIIGHSERRDIFHENDEEIGKKVAKALSCGMNVIACLGEHLEERKSGKTNEVLFRQLAAISANVTDWSKVVIAYEPVWAIGTGVVATPEQAQEAHQALRGWLNEKVSAEVAASVRIVYGGSVSAVNSADLAKMPDVDGFLVGGASLKPDFIVICKNLVAHKPAAH
ncbi:triosephosphate isomerase (TPI) [Monocercomonoides exilis]|uniref:triosephosphate isomerase (TPI) n=1 Tax=Monocercomonoides exilis TaxID=2049356 RepID=UPI003559F686|nr:triosephosphate isomerase (TPI) [Monocercomonoides exilis]|eukprot:MONOS_479.1-p1 / transcript=MONOS_479.1 / gene=MONOS_479 / organism=Monocercomonoides_exilis_PA203 / gene_product=triosephosphate isomerase (TPI) / transcript_product=triosephosphate isomerase (TPI) / location=Mono_scaffold00007:245909-246788(+) / protein_length=257 / sequence_SO=supercontig / SO=protein_coding / is_pseudo=false